MTTTFNVASAQSNVKLKLVCLCIAVEVKPLSAASAPAEEEETWVPVCRPEDLPKGETFTIATQYVRKRVKSACF